MAWNTALQQVKNRSTNRAYRAKIAQQKKEDNDKKDFLKKQTQDSQFKSLIFSSRKFQRDQFLLKLKLSKLKNILFAFRNRKRKLRMIQQLNDINESLSSLNEENKKRVEEHPIHLSLPTRVPVTFLKNMVTERSKLLKKKNEFHLYAKQLKLW